MSLVFKKVYRPTGDYSFHVSFKEDRPELVLESIDVNLGELEEDKEPEIMFSVYPILMDYIPENDTFTNTTAEFKAALEKFNHDCKILLALIDLYPDADFETILEPAEWAIYIPEGVLNPYTSEMLGN